MIGGLKTGARAALVLPSAADRIVRYRNRLEALFGEQPPEGLVFQSLGPEGPLWEGGDGEGEPVAWGPDEYKRWTARVWRPARVRASAAPDAPEGLERMRFYDCRHTAISMALHSTLVSGPHGMNLHNLAGWAGHDVQTLQRYYAHIIARYHGAEPTDLAETCAQARGRVEAEPFAG
jgi:integrase